MVVGFEKNVSCTVSERENVSRVIPRLVVGYLNTKVPGLSWNSSVVVITTGSKFIDLCSICDSLVIMKFMLEMKFCLLFRLKFRSARGASRHPVFMGNCPIISHTC